MAINLKQYTGSTITPTDDALLYDFIMSEQSGIFEGCEVTHLGANQLQISDGRGLIRGRVFTVSQQTILANVSPSGSVKGRLIVKVDLGNGEAPISLVTQAASALPELTQQDINRDGTVFELPLATYDVTEVLISGLASVATKLTAPIDDKLKQSVANLEKGKYNATAKKSGATIAITGPAGAETVVFVAPSDWAAGDKYTYNGTPLTLATLTGEPVEDAWKSGSPIQFFIQGNKAFFKAGGGSKIPQNLPPLNPNFKLEFSGTTVTITANKLPKNDNTAMLAGGVWVLDSKMPESPKGAIVKQWTAAELIDTTQTEESKETVTWTYTNWTKGEPVYCRQYTYNPKGQYNTTVMGGVASTLDKPPFMLPVFTGNHAIFGDETAGRIELYESGDLTLSPGTYDFFLVGGGGAGYKGGYSESSDSTGGGGAGGKTFTQKAVTVPKLTVCPALVGAGGSQSGITVNDSNFSAQAGGGANQSKGGSGGSGGGGGGEDRGNVRGGSGGSDGSNGADGYSKTEYHKGGTGQGTTTKSFGEVGGALYAGGGGGGACSGNGAGAAGGGGGGGNGGNGSSSSGPGTAGTANTGGGGGGGADRYNSPGGAGGSGIIIVRWNNAAQ